MNVCVFLEHRFDRTPNGEIWTQIACAYPFWLRYLKVFDSVRVVARVRCVDAVPANYQRADGDNVSFIPVPYYIGPWQYLQRARQIHSAIESAVSSTDAIILRVPSRISSCLNSWLSETKYPYALEVVGDPYDVFAPGSVRSLLRPYFRWWFTHQLKQQCQRATAISYVTEFALQKRYPPGLDAFSTHYSDVFLTHYSSIELSGSDFAPYPRQSLTDVKTYTLITVASLAQLYKAPDILIDAVAIAIGRGCNLQLVIVGDGKYRPELEARAKSRGIGEQVAFRGQLPAGEAILAELDRADLFVLPSHQEGLPRAMIEAMARGLPCIGSTVGGIPELLPPDCLVPPGNATALANKICEIVADPNRINQLSVGSLNKAADYREEVLTQRRLEFYTRIYKVTERWLNTHTI